MKAMINKYCKHETCHYIWKDENLWRRTIAGFEPISRHRDTIVKCRIAGGRTKLENERCFVFILDC